ncbi:MAG: hypothetical protein ACE5EY_17200, partial [Anaerolineae bacterium]
MLPPRDHYAHDRTGLIKAARIFSNVVSPPVMFALLGIAIPLKTLPFWPGFGSVVTTGQTRATPP